jgi:hypothetical protein
MGSLGHLAQHVGKEAQGAWRQFQDRSFVSGVAFHAYVKNDLDVIGFGMVQCRDQAMR